MPPEVHVQDSVSQVLAKKLWCRTLTPTSEKSLREFPRRLWYVSVSRKVSRHLPCSLLNTNYHILLLHSAEGQFSTHFPTFCGRHLCNSVTASASAALVKLVTVLKTNGWLRRSHPLPPGNQARTAQGASECRRYRLVSAIWAPLVGAPPAPHLAHSGRAP